MNRTALFVSFCSNRPLFLLMFLLASIPLWLPVAAVFITGVPKPEHLFIILLLIVTGRVYVTAVMSGQGFFDRFASDIVSVTGSIIRITLGILVFGGFSVFFAYHNDMAGAVISLSAGALVFAFSFALRGMRHSGRMWGARQALPPARAPIMLGLVITVLWVYLAFAPDFLPVKAAALLVVVWLSTLRFMRMHESVL